MSSTADVVTIGETMALVAAEGTGPFTVGSPARISFGGAETNVAIGLSRLGHRTAWIGRLGSDPVGAMVRDGLRAEGVDVSYVRVDDEQPTALMLREHRTADRVRVSYYRRGLAGSRLRPDDIDADLLTASKLVHVTGITPALSDSARAAVHHAIELARSAGSLVSFDLNYRAALWSPEAAGAKFESLVRLANLVFAGADEAALVVGDRAPEQAAKALAELGPDQVVLKLGPDGALGLVDGELVSSAAMPVSCVDPVGAGDAFVAGYLSGMLDGLPLDERLRRGNVCGGFAVSVSGDWEGVPRRHELGMFDGTENVAR